MQRDMTAPTEFSDRLREWFARLMRLDVPPVIEPLPDHYAEHRELPFVWDIIRSMLWRRAAFVMTASIAAQVMASLQPFALGHLIDAIGAGLGEQGSRDDVVIWVTVVFALWIGAPLTFQLGQLINVYLGPALRVAIKYRLFQHLMRHAPAYFHDNLPGRLAQKVSQAANSGQGVMNIVMVEVV